MNPSLRYLVIHPNSGSADITTSLSFTLPFTHSIDHRSISEDTLDIAAHRQNTVPELSIDRGSERGYPVAYEIFF
jgi:hypothetical protein